MSAIMQWAFGLCAAMVAMGLCHMLLPSSNMERMFRFVVSVFFLCVLLSPVAVRFPALMIEVPLGTQAEIDERARRVEETVHRQALQSAEIRLRQIIRGKLSPGGINPYALAINFTTSEQGEVVLESVDITLGAADRARGSALISGLEAELGSPVRLHFIDGGGGQSDGA